MTASTSPPRVTRLSSYTTLLDSTLFKNSRHNAWSEGRLAMNCLIRARLTGSFGAQVGSSGITGELSLSVLWRVLFGGPLAAAART